MDDSFHLQRFLRAQHEVIDQVLDELRAGRKRSHWMWFVFPQLAGLGASDMARQYSISGLAEARAYLRHAILGERLRRCTDLMLAVQGRDLSDVLGSPDDLKFRSCMTLFDRADPAETRFRAALEKYCAGEPDPRTLRLLGQSRADPKASP